MRNVKFRAWLVDEMVDDPIIYGVKGDQLAVGAALNEGLDNFFEDGEGKYVLMQWTGLNDKNGKLIYEGDIVRVYGNWTDSLTKQPVKIQEKVVEWDKEGCWYPFGGHDLGWNDLLVEVIGNIYENPDLLETNNTRKG